MQALKKYHRLIFYSAWLLLHLIQAFSTELFDDEAYYWVYSVFPAWGYFDHPPVIAILIKGGYLLFKNELGVRLLTIFLATASIYLIDLLIEKKNPLLFYAICGSLALAQIGGMMAVPDTPLMFFVALFFWLYRRFLANMNFTNTALIGICIALMLYTKYHGILVVFFTALSNPVLFRKPQPYLALIIALVLFTPHLYWQYQHGFPSLQFHLFERNSSEYEFKHTIEFIIGQIILAGPLMGWLLILTALLYKPVTETERALKFTFVGVYLFFLVSTIKGRAEANWTIPSFIGMIVLSHQYLLTHRRWRKWLYYSVPLALLLVFTARIFMMIDMPPAWWLVKDEFHQNKIWVNSIVKRADNLPVVFTDSYQKPSKYWFYARDTAMGLNTTLYRRNNYNFWKVEDSLIGKKVFAANQHLVIDDYFSFSRILIDHVEAKQIAAKEISVTFRTESPENYLPKLISSPYNKTNIYLTLYQKKNFIGHFSSGLTLNDIERKSQQNIVSFKFDKLPAGKYSAKFSIGTCIPGRLTINSSAFQIELR